MRLANDYSARHNHANNSEGKTAMKKFIIERELPAIGSAEREALKRPRIY